jgi:tripartite-type tricarboxylate transporter receptor subunit TctC
MYSKRLLRRRFKIVVVAVGLYIAPFIGPLHAQTPFYRGKTLTVINGNEPGGTADQRMRAVLPFFKKHIPGTPTVVAEYMPGGGGRKVANHIYGAARPDGLTMAFPPGSFVAYAIFKETGVSYDINKLIFVGDDPTPLSGEGMEKALHELPLEDSVIDFFKQISGSGPLPRS